MVAHMQGANRSEASREDEIAAIAMHRPHLVILGAGASRAAFPDGDANGRSLPLMANLVEALDLHAVLDEAGVDGDRSDFEGLYSGLVADPALGAVRAAVEDAIYDYFDSLQLPEEPTLYDHLLLSLRPKDVIATFNWDPFLIMAARRNLCLKGKVATMLFLHGNVWSGFCEEDGIYGVKRTRCSKCGREFMPSALLYPVTEKRYTEDPQIRNSWGDFVTVLRHAFMVTIFGYSAPRTDVEARRAMLEAWGGWRQREFEQIEIIDVRDEAELRDSWSDFIHTHHYDVEKDFYRSWIANHPRRTGEAYIHQHLEARFIESNPIPRDLDLRGLEAWFRPLMSVEEDSDTVAAGW